MAFQSKTFVAMMNIHLILSREIAFGKTQVVNGVQQVGFAYSIASADTNNALSKVELLLEIIFKLEE